MGIRIALNHRTHYRYDSPATLGPHIVRLRPAPHCRTTIESYSLQVSPGEHFINWQQDPFGNHQARLVFPQSVNELCIDVDLVADLTAINPFDFFVEASAEYYPFAYSDASRTELGPYLQTQDSGPLLQAWLDRHTPETGGIIDWLVTFNQRLHEDIRYQLRLQEGVQSPEQTLELASGSCRDSAWLLVQLLRHCNLAARFVSGYLVQLVADEKSTDGPPGPETDFTDLHAWAEVYLPGAGWVGLDPTSGLFAGEGHIPLSCSPLPASAAPITGESDQTADDFSFSNTLVRIDEKARVTKPCSDKDWQAVIALGQQVDQRLKAQDVRLTMGGEPTFVAVENSEAAEWNHAALGKHKLDLAQQLLLKMRDQFAPGGLPTFIQGKWYPGEPTPRWALACHWRSDEKPLWHSRETLSLPGQTGEGSREDTARFSQSVAQWLGVPARCAKALYEDPLYHLQLESLLPVDTDLKDLGLDDNSARRNLCNRLSQGIDQPVGWVLPLKFATGKWHSCEWVFRREQVFLAPGDSPAGLRLPLDSLPDEDDDLQSIPEDNFSLGEALPYDNPSLSYASEDLQRPTVSPVWSKTIRTALCIEWRDKAIHVFLPPTRSAVEYVLLLQALEKAALEAKVAIVIEGYEPPADSRLRSFRLTPDPGVLEVNVHPVENFTQLVEQSDHLYRLAKETGLSAEKFLVDGRHTGTGGGNHITFGGPTPADSPFLRRPSLLGSIITYWQHHPSLSYLFSGLFVGPTSQAPRIDEARHESLYELEMALSRLPPGDCDKPWLVDRLLRNLLIDVTGNTHRAEICIDKLYSPDGPVGRQGVVELRAFEMPPHTRMNVVQGLLLRSLISRFWDNPYQGKLIRWGSELHDRFMLPHYLWADMQDITDDLLAHNIPFEQHWLDAFWEFRFPVYGVRQVGDITLELRAAIEPWHVLGEEASQSGMSRYVDSSMERLQLKISGLNAERFYITCNGNVLPVRSTGVVGEHVVGIRFRAWQPPTCLHPDLPVDSPLVFDVVDRWMQRSLGGCAYHVSHPGGRHYEEVPVNANVAQARRQARFDLHQHTPQPARTVSTHAATLGSFTATNALASVVPFRPVAENPEFPHTTDLRQVRSKHRG